MMRSINTGISEKVLDYWFTIEFLAQDKNPVLTNSMKKTIAESKAGVSKRKTVPNFLRFDGNNLETMDEAIYSETKGCKMDCWGDLTIYIGVMKREACIQRIAKFLKHEGEHPEKNTDEIAWLSFRLSPNGKYIERSLSISTIIWALHKIKETKGNFSSLINEKDYQKDIERLEQEFFEQKSIYSEEGEDATKIDAIDHRYQFDVNSVSFNALKNIFKIFFSQFLEGHVENIDGEEALFREEYGVSFEMYKDESTKNKADVDPDQGLSRNFYANDIKLLLNKVKSGSLRDENINRSLIDYINEPYDKKYQAANRINLVYPKELSIFAKQVNDILDIRNAPLGKWPSKFSPVFMQQAAINLGIGRQEKNNDIKGTIFSVNGPPGTGKTTLIKEIVVNNVVERAILLSQYDDPDQAFIEHKFKKGDKEDCAYSEYVRKWYSLENDKINNYSMFITSCNNTAVENISCELPKGSSIIDQLQPSENDSAVYKDALKEVQGLFDVESTGIDEVDTFKHEFKDIYFSKHAKALLKDDSAWGLIAAALGKKSNIKSFYNEVLSPIIFTDFYGAKGNAGQRIERFKKAKEDFKEQLIKVKLIEEQLGCLCEAAKIRSNAKSVFELTRRKNQALIIEKESEAQKKEQQYCLIQAEVEKAIAHFNDQYNKYIDCKKVNEENNIAHRNNNTFIEECQQKEFEVRSSVGLFTKLFNKKKYDSAMQVANNYAFKILNAKEVLVSLAKYADTSLTKLNEAYSVMQNAEQEKNLINDNISLYQNHLLIINQQIIQLKEEIEQSESVFFNSNNVLEQMIKELSAKDIMDMPIVMDDEFILSLVSDEEELSTKVQTANPWSSKRYDLERIKLFNYALRLNKEFVLATNKCRDNFKTLAQYWGLLQGKESKRIRFHQDDKDEFVGALFQTLFLLVPVISSTFASVGRLLKDVKQGGIIGTLIVDEAGQAQPQMAVGALYRSRRAMIVGDPKQVEPVVTDDLILLKKLFDQAEIKPYSSDRTVSVQGFADAINNYGTYLENPGQDEDTWVGCPLLVHRRCISPMYDISNAISYNGIMKQQTKEPEKKIAEKFVYNKSQWINVVGKERGNKNHFVKEQGEKVCEILDLAFAREAYPSLYIISPFTTVVFGVKTMIENHFKTNKKAPDRLAEWLAKNIGTVHKFQGKEANEVVFLLGCDTSKTAQNAIKWVNSNIVNVACTRAKYRLYVVGDLRAWEKSDCISQAKKIIDTFALKEIDAIRKSGLPLEEQTKAINEAANFLPAVTAFSVDQVINEDGEIDYSVDTTFWIKGLNQDFLKYDLNSEQLQQFGFKSLDDIKYWNLEVSTNLIMGIKLYSLLSPIYENNKEIDASCCAILFCKAIEQQVKDALIDPFKKLLPNCIMRGYGMNRKAIALIAAKDNEFTLGAFTTIINKNKSMLAKQMDKIGHSKYSVQWWNSFENKLRDCTSRRNECCHSGLFKWEAQESLRYNMFFDDSKVLSVKRKPAIGGLMFESMELKRILS